MDIVYIVDFSVTGNSGKQKATREKASALSNTLGINNFIFISDKPREGLLSKIFGKLIFDITTAIKLLPYNNFIVVQRVLFLPITRFILFLKKSQVVSEYHADFREEIPHLNKSVLQKQLLYGAAFFHNFNFKISHGIIYNHPILKAKFDSIYNKPSIYSYNGSNYKEYYPLSKSRVRNDLNIESERIMFLFLGSVSKWHGVDYLIDIFNMPEIKAKKNIWLYIVGASDNRFTSELRKRISNDQTVILPQVDTSTANRYINSCDYCLLPVKQIRTSPGSPLKLYDYIACGKPVITQENLLGYSDEINRYKLGFTTDFTNDRKASKDILSIIDNTTDEEIEFFNQNNRAVSINEVSWVKRMGYWFQFLKEFEKFR